MLCKSIGHPLPPSLLTLGWGLIMDAAHPLLELCQFPSSIKVT